MFITYDVFCFLCRNNVEKCEDILSKGLNIDAVCNKKKPFNSTGLILSANEGHEEVVRMLLRRNADIHYRNVHNMVNMNLELLKVGGENVMQCDDMW